MIFVFVLEVNRWSELRPYLEAPSPPVVHCPISPGRDLPPDPNPRRPSPLRWNRHKEDTYFANTPLGFVGPKCFRGPRLVDVAADGNCCFRAFAVSLMGHSACAAFHAQFRRIAADEIAKKHELYAKKVRIDGTWAGSVPLDALGKIFSAQVNIYHGVNLECVSVSGTIGARRVINLLFRNGHFFGILGDIPNVRVARSSKCSSPVLTGGGRGTGGEAGNSFLPDDEAKDAFASLLAQQCVGHEAPSCFIQQPRMEAVRFRSTLEIGSKRLRLLGDEELQVGTYCIAAYAAAYTGLLGPRLVSNDLLTLTLFFLSLADYVKVEHQGSAVRQIWCYNQDDGSWFPALGKDSLPLATIQQWLFCLDGAVKVISTHLAACRKFLEEPVFANPTPRNLKEYCANIGMDAYLPGSLSKLRGASKSTLDYFDNRKQRSFTEPGKQEVYCNAMDAMSALQHLSSAQKRYMEQRNLESFVSHILAPYGADASFSEYMSESRPASVINYADCAIRVDRQGVTFVEKKPQNMALTTLPMELRAGIPQVVEDRLATFLETVFCNNEASFKFILSLLASALFTTLELQREYFLFSKGRSGKTLFMNILKTSFPLLLKTFGHELLSSHELLMRAGSSFTSSRVLCRSELPSRDDNYAVATDIYKNWTGLCPVTVNEKWQKEFGSMRFPQLKICESNNLPIYKISSESDLMPLLERNAAIPFFSTFLVPPSVPRGDEFLEFVADESLNTFARDRVTAAAFTKNIFLPFVMENGLDAIEQMAKTPPGVVLQATLDFRNSIKNEHATHLSTRRAKESRLGATTPTENRMDSKDAPHPRISLADFLEEQKYEGPVVFSDFLHAYSVFCDKEKIFGPSRFINRTLAAHLRESYTMFYDGHRVECRHVTPSAAKRRKCALIHFPVRREPEFPFVSTGLLSQNTPFEKRWQDHLAPQWYPRDDVLLSMWRPVFATIVGPDKLKIRQVWENGTHLISVHGQIFSANETVPKNFLPPNLQTEETVEVHLQSSNTAADAEKAKVCAETLIFGVFQGDERPVAALCGKGLWVPIHSVKKLEFSRAPRPIEGEVDQVDCSDENAFFPRAGDEVDTPDGEPVEDCGHVGGGGARVRLGTSWAEGGIAEESTCAKLYIFPGAQCSVCGGKLTTCKTDTVRARVASPCGLELVEHGAKRCCRKGCRTRHRYNYYWYDGEKINSMSRFEGVEAIFLSDHYGVSVRAVQMVAERLFRAKTSFLAEAASFNAVVVSDGAGGDVITDKRAAAYLQQAYFVYTKVTNLDGAVAPGENARFPIDDPITDADSPTILTWKSVGDVREVVFDGHFKLNRPLEEDEKELARRKRGRPRKEPYRGTHDCGSKNKWAKLSYLRTGGLLMAVHPGTGDILGMKELVNSETADEKVTLLAAVLRRHPDIDCLIHDDACHFQDQVEKRAAAGNPEAMLIKGRTRYYILDRFHERNHKCGARNRPSTARNAARVKNINTSRAESVFSWFRNYHHCNTMSRRHFRYFTQEMCRKHNASTKPYLNPWANARKGRAPL